MSRTLLCLAASAACLMSAEELAALQPVTPGTAALSMTTHQVEVVIENGFARVAVQQTFRNPNPQAVEAMYRAPLPQHAALSQVSIISDGREAIHGEVVEKSRAQAIYDSEKQAGNDVGLATKQDYRWFEFRVAIVPPNTTTTVTHVYYQPLTLDTGIGRFHYPRENGGTEDAAAGSFWEGNTVNEAVFSFSCELRSVWPITEIRMPGRTPSIAAVGEDRWMITANQQTKTGIAANGEATVEGTVEVPSEMTIPSPADTKDVVLYYRLADNLPGRVELIPYKPDVDKPGYFMMVLTPGLDLKPLVNGSDWTFILDRSGSMQGKIATLADGVSKAVQRMRPEDRFRIISFSDSAQWVTNGWQAGTPSTIQAACEAVHNIKISGGTDLYAGLSKGLSDLNDDRASQIVLVTDGVANLGQISPKAFHALSKKNDVRIHGFLLGNSANWPLMEMITKASGGIYAPVSNQDDIIGQLILAKDKVTREALHDADFSIQGVRTSDLTDGALGKIYHGQQLVIFGRYAQGGKAELTLKARLTGEDKTYRTQVAFPNQTTDHPEIARLWAMNRVEDLELQAALGLTPAKEATTAAKDLGIAYQIVTDETAMIVLTDDAFQRHGIERTNQQRLAAEAQAQAQRAAQPVTQQRVDQQNPMWSGSSPSVPRGGGSGGGRSGGGAFDPWSILALITASGMAVFTMWRKR